MKNFTELEKHKMVAKIQKIHDKIFSLPAKRYVFYNVDDVIGGMNGFAYDCLRCIKHMNIEIIRNHEDFDKFDFKFGDQLIIIYSETNLDIQNDIIFKKESINKKFPSHYSIIVQANFLYYGAIASLYRECLMDYQYQNHKTFPKIENHYAFEFLTNDL